MPITVVCPGTFDPITRGHLDVIERVARLFPRVIVGVAANPEKDPLFSLDEREEMIREAVEHLKNVEVRSFEGLLVDAVRAWGAYAVVKGLRTVSDFEYELQMALMNREMSTGVETLFVPAAHDVNFLSSSLIKEVARGGREVSHWLPRGVDEKLRKKLGLPLKKD